MMTVKIQIIIAIVIVVAFVLLGSLARKKVLDLKYIIAWILISAGVLVMDLIPEVMLKLSELIGIASPVNMIFFIGFLYLGFIVFLLSIAISRQSVRMKKIIQEIALINKEMEELKKYKLSENNKSSNNK